MACLSQSTCTWFVVALAAVIRDRTVLQLGELMFVHCGASWPPMAPSTMVSRGFRLGSRLARAEKLLVPLEAHSWVVFDIPLEISTIVPLVAGTPLVSSG